MLNNAAKIDSERVAKKTLKANLDNEKVKNKYFDFLKEAEGYSEHTINTHKKSIYRYEEFSGFADFRTFNKKQAIDYKKWLEVKRNPQSNKRIAISTVYQYIRNLKEFFEWLAVQPKYKSHISLTDVQYLKLSKDQIRMAISSKRERYPTLEQVRKVVHSIKINNEIDLRDRALICFTLVSGMRDAAIISLPVQAFNENTLEVTQDPKLGVKTKFSKTIHSVLFKFDPDMLTYFLDWFRYLKEEKLFGHQDPIFPRNKVENAEQTKTFTSTAIEPYFWQSVTSMREIFKARFTHVGLEYYSPHTFRHLAVMTAVSRCRNGHEIKAVSQNFGHENVGTTMVTYGTMDTRSVASTIGNMSFDNDVNNPELKVLEQFQEFLKQQEKGNF